MDPDLPVVDLMLMEEIVTQSIWQSRLYAILFTVFAGVTVLLAAIGIYGVMSYSVTQRTQEIGIRMALGAQVRDVLQLVVRSGLVLSLIGVAIGIAGAFALTRLLRTLLFGVTPTDAVTFIAVPAFLLFVALRRLLHPGAPRNEGRSVGGAEIRIEDGRSLDLVVIESLNFELN